AIASGARKAIVQDARDIFLRYFVWPALQAGALYEDRYPLATALGRPLLAKLLVDAARAENARFVAHGCTGKGNDQVRFDLAVGALAPDLTVIAPMRGGMNMTRDEEIDSARKHYIPDGGTKKTPSGAPRARVARTDEGVAPLQSAPWPRVRRACIQRPLVLGASPGPRRLRTEHAALRHRRSPRAAGPRDVDRGRATVAPLALLDLARDVRQGRRVRPTRFRGVHQGLRPAAPHSGQDSGALGRGKRSVARHPEEIAHRAEEGQADKTEEMSEEKKSLWSGRFTTGLERRVAGFTSSLELDHRIALHDVRGSLAHTRMLGRQRILSEKEAN